MKISLSQVSVSVGGSQQPLFQIPSFLAASGEKVLVKGASGKGKTTFLHLLAGLFTPQHGEVTLGETNLSHLDEEARCLFRRDHVGIVFQKLNLIEHLTAEENIQLSVRGDDVQARTRTAFEAVGLKGRAGDRVAVMSLGEQQRVAIARVLAGRFEIALADEPTSSLDEANAHKVTQLLLKACNDKTLIVVSHDHRIEKYFTRILDFEEMVAK